MLQDATSISISTARGIGVAVPQLINSESQIQCECHGFRTVSQPPVSWPETPPKETSEISCSRVENRGTMWNYVELCGNSSMSPPALHLDP